MKTEWKPGKDIYYTSDHCWIDFRGLIAYTGVCNFKLTGFKTIQEIRLAPTFGLKKQGDVVATIYYNDYSIDACMPIDGRILELNELVVAGKYENVLNAPEGQGWIALINPAKPYDRNGLLLPQEYRLKINRIYSKKL